MFISTSGDTLPGKLVIAGLNDDLGYCGDRLKGSAVTGYVGGAFLFLGASAFTIGTLLNNNGNKGQTGNLLQYSGGGAMAVGGIVTITAFIPIEAAGRTLRKRK